MFLRLFLLTSRAVALPRSLYPSPLATVIVDYVTTSSPSQFIRTSCCVDFNLRKETGRAENQALTKQVMHCKLSSM